MSWNHRVVVTEDGTHQVAEVHYEEDGTPRSWGATLGLVEIVDDPEEDLCQVLLWSAREAIRACYMPVLYVRSGMLTEVKGE